MYNYGIFEASRETLSPMERMARAACDYRQHQRWTWNVLLLLFILLISDHQTTTSKDLHSTATDLVRSTIGHTKRFRTLILCRLPEKASRGESRLATVMSRSIEEVGRFKDIMEKILGVGTVLSNKYVATEALF